jgi:hypothetical protein
MKARPTKITKLDKLDNFGNTTFVIEFDEGTKGFYTSKNPEQNKFVVGNVTDFEVEAKQGSKGPYNKITIPNAGFKPGVGKPQVDPRQQVATFAMSYTKDLIVASQVKLGDMEAVFDRMYKAIMSKVI